MYRYRHRKFTLFNGAIMILFAISWILIYVQFSDYFVSKQAALEEFLGDKLYQKNDDLKNKFAWDYYKYISLVAIFLPIFIYAIYKGYYWWYGE